jgi:hypothetical protein
MTSTNSSRYVMVGTTKIGGHDLIDVIGEERPPRLGR